MASPVNLNAVKSCKVPCFHQSHLLHCSLTTVTRIGKTHSSNCKVHSHTFCWSTCTKMRSNGYETTTSNTDVAAIVACYLLDLLRMLTAPHLIMPRLVWMVISVFIAICHGCDLVNRMGKLVWSPRHISSLENKKGTVNRYSWLFMLWAIGAR